MLRRYSLKASIIIVILFLPRIAFSYDSINLTVYRGVTPPSKTISVSNTSGQKLYYWIGDNRDWMSFALEGFDKGNFGPSYLGVGKTGTVSVSVIISLQASIR